MTQRRLFTAAVLTAPWLARAQADPLAERLRTGGCVVLLRHAQTDPGVGDPPGFRVDVCSSQRNLSDEGKVQSRRIGQWFSAKGLKPGAVLSSAWCRCKDTADLAFGQHALWPALNSTFGGRERTAAQTTQLRQAIARVPAGRFEVWVTHQVNITHLTGEGMAMGEALVVDTQGKVIARSTFA
jgi:phosphohistidine phosphatase SixA